MKKVIVGLAVIAISLGVSINSFAASSKPTPASGGMKMDMPKPSTPPLTGKAAKAGGTILDAPIPSSILSIPLQDVNGKTFTLGSLKGKTVVLTDFLTSCPDICPLTSVNMRQIGTSIAKAKLSDKIVSLAVSVDGKRDSVSRISAYQKMFNDNSWSIGTGSPSDLASLWKFFGVFTKIDTATKGLLDWQTGKQSAYDVQHADVIAIIGPDSHWRWLDLGNPQVQNPKSPNLMPMKLMNYLTEEGKVNLFKPEQPTWTTQAVYSALNEIFSIKIGG
jgi:protein SCO1/2